MPTMASYGFAPYEESQGRLNTAQRALAALSGLTAIRPGAGFGESFLQGLGGSARNVYLAQTQAQNAAREYAERQMEQEEKRERDAFNRRYMEAQMKQMERPPAPEKPPPAPKKDITNMTEEEWKTYIRRASEEAKARAAGRPAPQGGSVKATAAPKPVASKPSTAAEKQTLSYFNRMKTAEGTIQALENKMADLPLPQQYQMRYAPNQFQSADQQKYRQAQRAFTEARLRKESGAAIPQGEYDTDAKTYFAQPGDTKALRDQKRAARKAVLDGLKFSSGKAYEEFYGGSGGGGAATHRWNSATQTLEPIR